MTACRDAIRIDSNSLTPVLNEYGICCHRVVPCEATLDSMIETGQFDINGPVDLLLVSIAHDLVRLSGQSASPQLRGA